MGATHVGHRLNTPVALALVLALAGAASPAMHPEADGPSGAPDGSTTSSAALAPEEIASVTKVDPGRYPTPSGPSPAVQIALTGAPAGAPVRVNIADVLLQAYRSAVAGSRESCNLPVSLLAAIGQVESGSLAGRPLDKEHRTSVLGPVLDGNGFAAVADTDKGRWDGDTKWDRAVGPMQFIPGTWDTFGVDGDGDGVANPQDVEDAAAGTAAYLCYGGRDLSDPAMLRTSILSYNHSDAYLRLVMTYQQRYASLGLDAEQVTGLPTSTSALNATALQVPMKSSRPLGKPHPAGDGDGVVVSAAKSTRAAVVDRRVVAASTPAASPHEQAAIAASVAAAQATPQASAQALALTSPQSSPQASPQSSPQSSPQASPQASPAASPAADKPTPPADPTPPAATTPPADPTPPAATTPPADPTPPPATTPPPDPTPPPATTPPPDPTPPPPPDPTPPPPTGTCPTQPLLPGDPVPALGGVPCEPCPAGVDPTVQQPCLPAGVATAADPSTAP